MFPVEGAKVRKLVASAVNGRYDMLDDPAIRRTSAILEETDGRSAVVDGKSLKPRLTDRLLPDPTNGIVVEGTTIAGRIQDALRRARYVVGSGHHTVSGREITSDDVCLSSRMCAC